MIGRPKVPLVLTTPEQQALDSLAHRARAGLVERTAPQVARRARIVLACARGLDNQTVAKKLRVSHGGGPQMVGRWRARFVTRRVDGLLDALAVGVIQDGAPELWNPCARPSWPNRWSRPATKRSTGIISPSGSPTLRYGEDACRARLSRWNPRH